MLSNRTSNNHTIWCRKSSYRNKIEMHYMKKRSLNKISNYYYWEPLKNITSIKITLTCFGNKYFPYNFADKRLWVLNISVTKICKLLWCIETGLFKKMKKEAEFSLWRSSWNADVPLYVIFRAVSCIEFFFWLLKYILTNILTYIPTKTKD